MRTGVMSFLVYFFVLLVAASSVLFGLDWMQAPLQPPARTQQPAALVSAPAQPAPASTSGASIAEAKTADTDPATPLTATPADIATGSTPTEALKSEATETKPAPLCDIAACERAYHTFTAADCTYKPSWGPRRLCTRGNPPRRPSAQTAAKEANAQPRCNVSACESAYQSFDAATCTYQTFGGARRVCTK
jgi:hypothetical protein